MGLPSQDKLLSEGRLSSASEVKRQFFRWRNSTEDSATFRLDSWLPSQPTLTSLPQPDTSRLMSGQS